MTFLSLHVRFFGLMVLNYCFGRNEKRLSKKMVAVDFWIAFILASKENASQKKKNARVRKKSAQKKQRNGSFGRIKRLAGCPHLQPPPLPARNGMPNGTTNGPAPAAGRWKTVSSPEPALSFIVLYVLACCMASSFLSQTSGELICIWVSRWSPCFLTALIEYCQNFWDFVHGFDLRSSVELVLSFQAHITQFEHLRRFELRFHETFHACCSDSSLEFFCSLKRIPSMNFVRSCVLVAFGFFGQSQAFQSLALADSRQ